MKLSSSLRSDFFASLSLSPAYFKVDERPIGAKGDNEALTGEEEVVLVVVAAVGGGGGVEEEALDDWNPMAPCMWKKKENMQFHKFLLRPPLSCRRQDLCADHSLTQLDR